MAKDAALLDDVLKNCLLLEEKSSYYTTYNKYRFNIFNAPKMIDIEIDDFATTADVDINATVIDFNFYYSDDVHVVQKVHSMVVSNPGWIYSLKNSIKYPPDKRRAAAMISHSILIPREDNLVDELYIFIADKFEQLLNHQIIMKHPSPDELFLFVEAIEYLLLEKTA